MGKRSDTTLEFSDSAVWANRVRNVGVTVNYSDGCFDFSSQMISKRGMNEETNRRRIPFLSELQFACYKMRHSNHLWQFQNAEISSLNV
ncbi:hypothetical protein QL285_020483 [Trifolium repens]|nr:hypothetical protein QL285_020483 [Trifolium repens]